MPKILDQTQLILRNFEVAQVLIKKHKELEVAPKLGDFY